MHFEEFCSFARLFKSSTGDRFRWERTCPPRPCITNLTGCVNLVLPRRQASTSSKRLGVCGQVDGAMFWPGGRLRCHRRETRLELVS